LLAGLKSGHPRLYLDPERVSNLLEMSQVDAFLSRLIEALAAESNRIIGEPPDDFRVIGPRMLQQSQTILKRISNLGLVYLLTGNDIYIRRAKDELLNAAAFPHWNESHFLDTAELCNAFAIGYDWLYSRLTDPEKRIVRTALIEKGLKAGLRAYESDAWWISCSHNWNLVCNGGLLAGALALADEEPGLSGLIVKTAIQNLPFAMRTYGPDGGWEAGPEYWEYSTRYGCFALDVLKTALGQDFDLSQSPGFPATGLFPIYCSGPLDHYFNFADSHCFREPQPAFFWLGRKYSLDACVQEAHRLLEKHLHAGYAPDAFDVVWYQPPVKTALPQPKKAFLYRGIQTVFLRSSWNDPAAVFVGFKGGSNRADHAHLDLGSFILDALGVRWAADLGPDDYDIPGYWEMMEGGGRWRLFRLNNRSHNTLVLNDDLQRADAAAKIIKTDFTEAKSFAIADLTGAYQPHAESLRRGIALLKDGTVVVQDEIIWTGRARKVRWQVMTDAQLKVSGAGATFTKSGKTCHAKMTAPADVPFETFSAHREPPENSNEGYRLLAVDYQAPEDRTTLCAVFSARPAEIEILPLREW